jgi:4a-hydroxytetrahydrobiopterin dehydratase
MEWTSNDGRLEREFRFADFVEAFAFMTRVALLAERQQHHPDMCIRWNVVNVSVTSHDAGNTITGRDHRLATAIDDLVAP